MKKLNLVAYADIAFFIFYGCTKSGSSSPKTSAWKLNGLSYTAKTTLFTSARGASELTGSDTLWVMQLEYIFLLLLLRLETTRQFLFQMTVPNA